MSEAAENRKLAFFVRLCYLDCLAGFVILRIHLATSAMKNPTFLHLGVRSARRPGFTLIELLVVIAIIVVLAAAGFQAGNFALNRAKKITALAACTELEKSIQNFYDDNGTMPIEIDADEEFNSNSTDGVNMLRVLMNQETADAPLNAKGIKYLGIKEGKGTETSGKGGLIWNTTGNQVLALFDPWGGDYKIMIDGDFDETITVRPKGATSDRVLQRRVAVWSDGADGARDENGNVRDDVITW